MINPALGMFLGRATSDLEPSWSSMAENREAADRLRRLSYTQRGPEELAGQDARDLIEDRWGDADLDQAGATEGEHFCRPCRRSSTRKCRYWCRPRHATGRGGTPGRRAPRRLLSCRLSEPGRRHSTGAHANVAPHRSGAAPPEELRSWWGLPAWPSVPGRWNRSGGSAGLLSACGSGGPAPRQRDHVRFVLGPVVQGGGIEIGTAWPDQRVDLAVK